MLKLKKISEKIEIVKKDSFFSEELTEEERKIIAQRVRLQQQQFAAFNNREKVRKSKAIRKIFDYVNDEEIDVILQDNNDDEVIFLLCWNTTLCNTIFNRMKQSIVWRIQFISMTREKQ